MENVVSLSAVGGALGLYLKGKAQELTLDQRKVTALELIAEGYAKKAGIEVKPKEEKKKGVYSLFSPLMTKCAEWAYFAGNLDGISYVASKGVSGCAISA